MGEQSQIGYVHASWGPWRGCRRVSPGCAHCYAEREMCGRCGRRREWEAANCPGGVPTRARDATFYAPLSLRRWPAGTRVFVCPWSDFFHEGVPADWRADALGVIEQRPDLTWIVPTKRPELILPQLKAQSDRLVQSNVWLLLSVEDQERADLRLTWAHELAPYFGLVGISAEPLLGPIDLHLSAPSRHGIRWIVMGAESGPHPRWGQPECGRLGGGHWCPRRDAGPPACGDHGDCPHYSYQVDRWMAWLVDQAVRHGIACYVKQVPIPGPRPRLTTAPLNIPRDLCVRQFPRPKPEECRRGRAKAERKATEG